LTGTDPIFSQSPSRNQPRFMGVPNEWNNQFFAQPASSGWEKGGRPLEKGRNFPIEDQGPSRKKKERQKITQS